MITQELDPRTSSRALAAWVGLLRAHASLTRQFNAELVAEHGLTISGYEALLRLARAPDGRMRRVDLAESLLLTPSGVTRLLDGLERTGLVCKGACSADARVTYAVLTDLGRAKIEAASHAHVAAVGAYFGARFAPEDLAALAELLGRIPGTGAGADECTVT